MAGKAGPTRIPDVFHGVPVSGTTASGGTFTGTLDVRRFVAKRGHLAAVVSLNGTIKNANGDVVGMVTNQIVRLRLSANGACRILHLVLGPLDLDLLGLRVHLNRVVLDITAVAGLGHLLGNLLCSVAHLLDRNLAGAMNQLNRLLLVRIAR